jgi:RHS repeat-associated protein
LACTPPSAPNELVELARALKWNPDLIYEYVHNNIKTVPIYDSLKGPLGTVLDGAGTPVDQAELTYTLLQQSCFSPQYQVGMIFLTPARLDKWLGTAATIDANQYNGMYTILAGNGFCTSVSFSPYFCNGLQVYTLNGIITGADVPWIWVSVPINGTTYQFDPASKIFPNNGGDGYYPYSTGLGTNLTTALGYNQTSFLNGARTGATGPGTPALTFAQAGRNNVRNNLAQYANNLVSYIKGSPSSAAATTDIIGGSTIQPLPTYAPPPSGNTLWGQTALLYPNLQGIPPTTTGSLSAFRTTLTLTLGWNDQNSNFTQLANPVTFNSADIHGRRLVIQFSASNIASLLLDGVTQATASAAVPSNNRLTARAAIVHPHMPCNSLPIPASCTGGPGPNIDNLRVTPAQGAIFVVGNGWGGSNRGVIERHRKLLRQNLIAGQLSTSEGTLGESLAMIGSTWLAAVTRTQLVTGELTGTTVSYLHAVGIVGMMPVGSSQGPYVDLPLNTVGPTQRVSRPLTTGFTAVESSAFFTVATIASMFESATIEQTQPKDKNGQVAVAASTMKLLDIWSTAGTIYDLNDSTISGDDCSYYVANVKNNLVNFTTQDKARVEALIGYSASTNTCSTPASTTQVIVPSNGNIPIGLWNGTGYLAIFYNQNQIAGIGAIISGGLSGGQSGSEDPPDTANENQAFGPSPLGSTDNYNNSSPSQIGNGISSWVSWIPGLFIGGSSGTQPSGGDPVNLVTGAYTYSRQDIAVGSGSYPYALPFVRSYDSASGQAGANSSALGNGWMHNYDMTAFTDSDAFEAMGENSPISGAAGIAAIYVIQDILNLQTSNAKPADRLIVAAQIERWLSDQSTGNIVAVTQPGSIERFALLPNSGGANVYVPPLGSSSQLTAIAGAGYSYRLKTGETLTFNPATAVASGRVTNWNSPSGASVVFSYNSAGKLQSIANPATQRQLNLHYTNQLLTSVDDNVGGSPRTVSYSYDGQSNLVAVQDPLQQTTTFGYGAVGQLTQIFYPSNPGNPFVTTTYDSLGRASRQSDAVGNTATLFFAGARSETDDPAGTAHVSYFSQRGKTLATIEGLGSPGINNGAGNKTSYAYDGRDRLTTVTAPEGGTSGYIYSADFNDNVTMVTRTPKPGSPLAPLVTTYSYDSVYNKPTQMADPLGLVTSMSYDGATGNLITWISDVGGSPHFNARRSFTYNPVGQVLTAADPLGTVTQFGYDSFGNQTSIIRDIGAGRLNQLTSYSYNAQGDVVSITDPKGNVTTSAYDAARRLTATTAPNGLMTAYSYDPDGHVIQAQQSASGTVLRSTGATYTLTGKPATATDANNNTTSFTYDLLDRVSSMKDAMGRATSYGYDALSRQTSISNLAIQSSPLLQQSYTPDGLLASLTDANNHATSFAYDGFDRLATTTYPLGSTETLTYDADSNVSTRKTRANQTIGFAYDTLNRLITKTPPSPAPVVSYRYDLAGRLMGVSDTSAAITAAVPPSGPWVQYATTAAYDALNRPTGISWNPSPTAAAPSASSVTFAHAYNKANQRIGQTATDNSWLNYPAASASTVSYTANALNQYTAVGAVRPIYDGNGSLTFDGTFTLGYDAENRLTSASGTGNTASYSYDAQGRRKTKIVNGTTTVFVTDADNREVLEYDGATGAILRWYAYGLGSNDVLNQMNVAAATRATLVPDIQGSVIASLDSSSGVFNKTGYLPYGKSASVTGPFGYTAQRIDPETNGLYYYRARHYSPSLGRFMQADPIGTQGGANLYAYVLNDPMSFVDPMGLTGQQNSGSSPTYVGSTMAIPAAGGALAEGVGAVGLGMLAVVGLPLALSGDTVQTDKSPFTYATYTRTNPITGQVYSGRTSGYGDPSQMVAARGAQQSILSAEGFLPPTLDVAATGTQAYGAIRGREQQLINYYGGAQSVGGTARNVINGIADFNPAGPEYVASSVATFGALPDNSPPRLRLY